MGVVIIVAVTGWMTRDFWSPALFDPVVSAKISGWQGGVDAENPAIKSVGYVEQQRDAIAATR